MLRRYSELFRSVLLLSDMVLIGGSWLLSYQLRFYGNFEAPQGIPAFRPYAELLLAILPIWFLLYRARRLYEPWRVGTLGREVLTVLTANATGIVALVVLSFFLRSYFYSRTVLVLFFGLSSASVITFRTLLRGGLRSLRRRGYNLRHVVVVGAGDLAGRVIDRVHSHPETGLHVVGVLGEEGTSRGRDVRGVPVLGTYGDIKHLLADTHPDLVLVALPAAHAHELEKILGDVDDEVVNVRVVPDLPAFMTLRAQVEELDGIPLISLREGPLVGWASVRKRALDIAVSSLGLLVASPVIAAVALAVRLTSGRPVLFAQERMGLDGRVFRMIKFRTMRNDAEGDSGPVWTVPDDPRRTGLGSFLRRTSLDELPQLWNVLRGDMSLVGPRPERPVFIEQFRREIPGYMLRHKIKAGLTGWAQIHGWRGNTSLHERVEHDLYYIQHWSIGLDLWILWMTLWRGILHRNAY
jgi:Undecaprenyl-phosphate glucose phosphotransferase